MRIHYLQNHPKAYMGHIETWVKDQGYTVSRTLLGVDSQFPSLNDFDLLIISGGPMGVYQMKEYPWLEQEIAFIRKAIESKKFIWGICLGAQLVAAALGEKVYPHDQKEVGWWPINLTDKAKDEPFLRGFPDTFIMFQYHGDTFDLPKSAVRLATNPGCLNQAYKYSERVFCTQFHPEYTQDMITYIAEAYSKGHEEGPYIQKPEEFLEQKAYLIKGEELLYLLLNNIEKEIQNS